MLFCKHNSAFTKPSTAEGENQVLTLLSYSELTFRRLSSATLESAGMKSGKGFRVRNI